MFSTLLLFVSLLITGVFAHPWGPPVLPKPPEQRPPHSGPAELWHSIKPQSPKYPWLFEYPLPIAPVAQPLFSEEVNGGKIEYFELTLEAFEQQIYPNLGPAHLVGYNRSSPGPTFRLERGVESIVRVLNNGPGAASMHLHGSPSHAPWDGWAIDLIQPGQFKDYYYPNNQAGSLWYHDHVDGESATNIYRGQAGIYLIHNPEEDVLGLPEGKYDIPLSLVDTAYHSNGDLVSPENEVVNFYGDTIEVNGQPWPYLNVEPRKYRFRFYDMSLSRPYDLSFVDDHNNSIEVQVVASDAGLFEYPVSSKDVMISMGERYEIVIDFAPFKDSNVTIMNILHDAWIPEFVNTDKIMRLVVGASVSDSRNNGPVPLKLRDVNWPPQKNTIDHVFNFQHGGDNIWTINGEAFDDINNRVLARPPQGSVETWKVNYASGPGIHPVHVHLVNLQILSRTGGSRGVLPYEAAGLKDTVLLDPGESVLVRAVYGPWNGLYTFHCHNLIHEDHMMMDALNVTLLEGLGYKFDSTYDFQDPNDPRYAAQDYTAAAFTPAAIQKKVIALGNLNAYKPAPDLAAAEANYYATAGYPTVSAQATPTLPAGRPWTR